MQRLKVYRVQHWLNDSGREVTNEGKAVPQEVNLRRLILLIKPVSRSVSNVINTTRKKIKIKISPRKSKSESKSKQF